MLTKLGENWSVNKKVPEFKKYVSDPNYDTEFCVRSEDFAALIDTIHKREQDLECAVIDTSCSNKCSRRVHIKEDQESDSKGDNGKEKNKFRKAGNKPIS